MIPRGIITWSLLVLLVACGACNGASINVPGINETVEVFKTDEDAQQRVLDLARMEKEQMEKDLLKDKVPQNEVPLDSSNEKPAEENVNLSKSNENGAETCNKIETVKDENSQPAQGNSNEASNLSAKSILPELVDPKLNEITENEAHSSPQGTGKEEQQLEGIAMSGHKNSESIQSELPEVSQVQTTKDEFQQKMDQLVTDGCISQEKAFPEDVPTLRKSNGIAYDQMPKFQANENCAEVQKTKSNEIACDQMPKFVSNEKGLEVQKTNSNEIAYDQMPKFLSNDKGLEVQKTKSNEIAYDQVAKFQANENGLEVQKTNSNEMAYDQIPKFQGNENGPETLKTKSNEMTYDQMPNNQANEKGPEVQNTKSNEMAYDQMPVFQGKENGPEVQNTKSNEIAYDQMPKFQANENGPEVQNTNSNAECTESKPQGTGKEEQQLQGIATSGLKNSECIQSEGPELSQVQTTKDEFQQKMDQLVTDGCISQEKAFPEDVPTLRKTNLIAYDQMPKSLANEKGPEVQNSESELLTKMNNIETEGKTNDSSGNVDTMLLSQQKSNLNSDLEKQCSEFQTQANLSSSQLVESPEVLTSEGVGVKQFLPSDKLNSATGDEISQPNSSLNYNSNIKEGQIGRESESTFNSNDEQMNDPQNPINNLNRNKNYEQNTDIENSNLNAPLMQSTMNEYQESNISKAPGLNKEVTGTCYNTQNNAITTDKEEGATGVPMEVPSATQASNNILSQCSDNNKQAEISGETNFSVPEISKGNESTLSQEPSSCNAAIYTEKRECPKESNEILPTEQTGEVNCIEKNTNMQSEQMPETQLEKYPDFNKESENINIENIKQPKISGRNSQECSTLESTQTMEDQNIENMSYKNSPTQPAEKGLDINEENTINTVKNNSVQNDYLSEEIISKPVSNTGSEEQPKVNSQAGELNKENVCPRDSEASQNNKPLPGALEDSGNEMKQGEKQNEEIRQGILNGTPLVNDCKQNKEIDKLSTECNILSPTFEICNDGKILTQNSEKGTSILNDNSTKQDVMPENNDNNGKLKKVQKQSEMLSEKEVTLGKVNSDKLLGNKLVSEETSKNTMKECMLETIPCFKGGETEMKKDELTRSFSAINCREKKLNNEVSRNDKTNYLFEKEDSLSDNTSAATNSKLLKEGNYPCSSENEEVMTVLGDGDAKQTSPLNIQKSSGKQQQMTTFTLTDLIRGPNSKTNLRLNPGNAVEKVNSKIETDSSYEEKEYTSDKQSASIRPKKILEHNYHGSNGKENVSKKSEDYRRHNELLINKAHISESSNQNNQFGTVHNRHLISKRTLADEEDMGEEYEFDENDKRIQDGKSYSKVYEKEKPTYTRTRREDTDLRKLESKHNHKKPKPVVTFFNDEDVEEFSSRKEKEDNNIEKEDNKKKTYNLNSKKNSPRNQNKEISTLRADSDDEEKISDKIQKTKEGHTYNRKYLEQEE